MITAIDPHSIYKVKIYRERRDVRYHQVKAKPPKTILFGLIIWRKAIPNGWRRWYEEEKDAKPVQFFLAQNNSIVFIENDFYYKPYVEFYFTGTQSTEAIKYDSFEIAKTTVQDLISRYNLSLEIIYDYDYKYE